MVLNGTQASWGITYTSYILEKYHKQQGMSGWLRGMTGNKNGTKDCFVGKNAFHHFSVNFHTSTLRKRVITSKFEKNNHKDKGLYSARLYIE